MASTISSLSRFQSCWGASVFTLKPHKHGCLIYQWYILRLTPDSQRPAEEERREKKGKG